jgi:ubiquinone biosynthesis protein
VRALVRNLKREAPQWATLLPQLPRLLHHALERDPAAPVRERIEQIVAEQRQQTRLLVFIGLLLACIAAVQMFTFWRG